LLPRPPFGRHTGFSCLIPPNIGKLGDRSSGSISFFHHLIRRASDAESEKEKDVCSLENYNSKGFWPQLKIKCPRVSKKFHYSFESMHGLHAMTRQTRREVSRRMRFLLVSVDDANLDP
jgi:hypothetical protein